MNKKLMLLVAGALSALAFTALPGAASAEETAIKCEKNPCTYTVTGGQTTFSSLPTPSKPADTVTCTKVEGSGAATPLTNNEATTGNVELTFTGCVETNTGFKFACKSPGAPNNGEVTTNTMITHILKLPAATAVNELGILLTSANVTFSCAGGLGITTVTDNIIGEFETKCGAPSKGKVLKVNFLAERVGGVPQHGKQAIREWTSKPFDLKTMTNHPGGEYDTAAQEGTGTLTFPGEVEITCAK